MRYALSLIFALTICLLQAKAESKPNVLFLAVDDMNDWIGCLGTTPRAVTPNLDRLAARGVNFTNAHTAGVFCAPSRAAIFSGQFASTTGCYRTATYFVDHPEIESLQVSFANAGYHTFGAGKLFHHPAGAIDIRGWDEFFLRNQSQRENGWPLDSWSAETPFPEPFPNSIYNRGQEITGGLFLEWGAIPNDREEEMADTIRINRAVEKLKKKHDHPFFLAVGIYAPHFPNYCPQKYFDLYDPEEIELPLYKADDLDDLPEKIRKIKTARSRIHQKLEGLNAVDDAIHGYLASISYADAMMGRVLDALEASPYADNTIVVLWSDHGYHHGEKGDWGKHTLWQRTSSVPFIWAGPGVAKGKKSDVTVSLIDMYPTLVDLCGLAKPQQTLEGESLAKTLANPEAAKDRNVLLPHMNPGEYAVINRDWRYIRYGDDGEELYDLKADPHEWDNLAQRPEYLSVKGRMRGFAPKSFAEPGTKLNARKDLVLEGGSFHWEKGKGNYTPPPKHLPYNGAGASQARNPAIAPRDGKGARNVLFIVCDDLNTHVSPSGYSPIHTPTLAGLAAESMTFRRAYCQYPVCGPSRASFLHGLYPQSSGVQKPHVPFLAPDKYFDLYPENEITFKPNRPGLWDSLPRTAISKRYQAFGFELGKENPPLRREYMQAYHACISFVDTQLKIVLDALKESGHWDDTVIIFTSDHGYHLGDHFLWGKVTLFDIGARVPFIIRVPGLTKAATTSDAMVELVDIYPTVADLTGMTSPDHLQGVSLRPLLGHPERRGKKKFAYSVVSRGQQLGYALRNQRWRYGKWPDGEELYNLTNDPEERNNLAGNPQFAERLQELRQILASKQQEAGARR